MLTKFIYRGIEALSIGAYSVFMFLIGREIISSLKATPVSPWFTILIVGLSFLGYVTADLISGIIHFTADNFGSDKTWLVGQKFIHPFREHHVDPTAITRHGFLEVNGDNCLLSLIVLVPTYYFLAPGFSHRNLALNVFIIFLFAAIFFTNQIHRWAHMEDSRRPAFISWLQNRRLILSPQVHDIHHTSPYDTYYCITSGWLNKILERSGIFEKIVALVKPQGKR